MKRILWTAAIITIILCLMAAVIGIFSLPLIVLNILGIGVIISLIVIGGGFLFYAGTLAKINVDTRLATRDKARLESNLIPSGGEVWVREVIEEYQNGKVIGRRIEYARLGGIRLRVNSHDHSPTESERLYATTQQSTGQTKMLAAGQVIPQLPAPVDLLSHLDRAERVLIKGASDAGKTTLLQHIAQRSNGIFIVDPHFTPGIWPINQSKIIGGGRDYAAIDLFLSEMLAEVNSRYARRARGELNFDQITLIIDEFQSIRAECNEAGKILSTLIRESRKVGFRLFIGSHSELVKPLGLEGQGDIRDGLLIIRLEIDQITKQRRVTMDAGHGTQECYFPPFGAPMLPEPVIAPPAELLQPTPKQAAVLELWQSGIQDVPAIAGQVYGPGGRQEELVRNTLRKFGLL